MSSSSSFSSGITAEQLKTFHSIDREIFSRLVIQLGRDVEDSMRVIGLWFWLEEMGSNLIFRLQSTPDFIVNLVFNEALHCLNHLETMVRRDPSEFQSRSPQQSLKEEEEDTNMGFTLGLLNTAALSSRFSSNKKLSLLRSVNRFVTDVAPRAFDDIIQQALVHRAQVLGGLSSLGPLGGGAGTTQWASQHDIRGKQIVVGPCQPISPRPMSSHSQFVGSPSGSGSNPMAIQPPYTSDLQVIPNDRTLFVTFSRGYPITAGELNEFFTRSFGDCIEGIYLDQDTEKPNEQALFALVVVRSATLLDLILEKAEDGKVKFVINGKHARARKYLSKGST